MKKSGWIVLIGAGVLLAVIVVLFLYRGAFFPGDKKALDETARIVSEKPENHKEEVVRKPIELSPPEEKPPQLRTVEKTEQDILQKRVEALFAYLDRQEYLKDYNLEEGTYQHFLNVASKLSMSHPVVSGEMDDLSLLRSNMTHFYRVMGKRDVLLVLDILSHEGERIEDDMALLFEWGVREAQRKEGAIGADMDILYDYAVFFLNTVGGRAYLLRRESRIRILLTYYSILIVDRANRYQRNRYGVDILPHVNLLIGDLERYEGLDYKDRYLEKLNAIEKHNQR